MASKIVTRAFKTSFIERFIASIGSTIEDSVYYLFYGDHVSSGVTPEDVEDINDSVRSVRINPYRGMIAGKRLTQNNAAPMIPRHTWESGRVYSIYDDVNENLFNEPFYVSVEGGVGEDVHVFKCLFNNNGAETTEEPNIGDVIGNNDEYYETSDGYQWKYMYSIPAGVFQDFKTDKFIPVVDFVPVGLEKNVVPGTIEVIAVDEPGAGYNNYYPFGDFEGKFDRDADIQVRNNDRIYAIRSPGIAQNFYANTIISLIEGSGSQDGSFRKIIASEYNPATNRVELTIDDAFAIRPDLTTRFVISPEVRVFGNGSETITASGRAIINTTANSISSVEMLSVGENYDFATASVLLGGVANSTGGTFGVFETSNAAVRPIVSPRDGHGSDPAYELGATALGISIELTGAEGNTIPAENTFAQFGIVKNPEFINIRVNHNKLSNTENVGSDGDFVDGEEVLQFNRLAICGNVNITVNQSAATHTLTAPIDFPTPGYDQIISPGDTIYIRDNRDQELRHHVGQVISATADTIVANGTPIWEETITDPYDPADPNTIPNTQLFIVQEISRGVISEPIPGTRDSLVMRNVKRPFLTGKQIIGTESFATATVTTINTNDRLDANVVYDFATYLQATRCEGVTVGAFQQNETVKQFDPVTGETVYEAVLHSQTNDVILLTNTLGRINTTLDLIGQTTGARMSNIVKHEGDLDAVTGEIVFLENNIPIERDPNESEQIRVILEF